MIKVVGLHKTRQAMARPATPTDSCCIEPTWQRRHITHTYTEQQDPSRTVQMCNTVQCVGVGRPTGPSHDSLPVSKIERGVSSANSDTISLAQAGIH